MVREGYDRVSRAYRPDGFEPAASEYVRWLAWLDCDLRQGSQVLDLGCGCGLPVARSLAHWLRPGGRLLVTVGHAEWTGTEEDWLGVPGATMYWSHAAPETYREWLAEEGVCIVREDRVPEGRVTHPVLYARLAGRGEP